MLPAAFAKEYDQKRLKGLLAILFLALAVPTGAVIWQAYDQLKWESWYQYRNQAEELTGRIDFSISRRIAVAEARNFTDFSFLNVTPSVNVLQRSPLSTYPVPQDVPGVIGYFQVDPDGNFSTPLIPGDGVEPTEVGLEEDDYAKRRVLADNIRRILADNQLVRDRVSVGGRVRQQDAVTEMVKASASPGADLNEAVEFAESPAPTVGALRAGIEEPSSEQEYAFEQKAFDLLNQPARAALIDPAPEEFDDAMEGAASQPRANAYGKVQDLRLDQDLQEKSDHLNRELAATEEERSYQAAPGEYRARRVEKAALPSAPAGDAGSAGKEQTTITTFESEIDPYQFSLLDSGHLVLFRNVWRDSSRYIQGLLIDQSVFSEDVIESAFRATTLAGMSNLIVGYHDDVINVVRGDSYDNIPGSASELDGSLLFRSRLAAPFDSLELIFSINRMPPGPGITVLGWTTVVIAIVFLVGFFALYRLGVSQINLARQQQDFVSAVSHELKTPLTSIRMYGEMLKEGWADEEKQKQYYEYIHDESERLTRLISNVLHLARITRNEPQFDLKPTSIGELMDQILSKISNHVQRAGFELTLSRDANVEHISVSVDDDCFAQIIINLVDNAIKFAKDAEVKKIDIGCRLSGDNQVEITVRDYGPGIPRTQLKKIFRLFYRTESELTRETVGTGIGLAIVHQLTTAMNGTVDVVNKEPGAEFRVAFPAKAD